VRGPGLHCSGAGGRQGQSKAAENEARRARHLRHPLLDVDATGVKHFATRQRATSSSSIGLVARSMRRTMRRDGSVGSGWRSRGRDRKTGPLGGRRSLRTARDEGKTRLTIVVAVSPALAGAIVAIYSMRGRTERFGRWGHRQRSGTWRRYWRCSEERWSSRALALAARSRAIVLRPQSRIVYRARPPQRHLREIDNALPGQ